jgi:hypothetical protein
MPLNRGLGKKMHFWEKGGGIQSRFNKEVET